jgi:heat shock protein HtpX
MAIGLQSHIWNNNLKSVILLTLYPLIIFVMIWLIAYVVAYSQGGYKMVRTEDSTGATWTNVGNPEYVANNLIMAYWPAVFTVIILWFIISYFWNTNMVRALSHAKPITRKEEPELYNLVENLCIAEGMKMPQLNIIETPACNAFASGIDDRSYTITVTRGLMQHLGKDELEAVLGHELTHIINRDVRLLIVTVIFTGMIGFAAQMVWSSLRYGRFYRGSGRNKGGGILILLAVGIILWVGYMATLFMRFAISRRREYMADAGSIQLTKNPDAMMRALMKIAGRDYIPQTTEDVRMMCIENGHNFMGLFATHPPIEKRIRAIAELTNTPVPQITVEPPAPEEMPAVKGLKNPWRRRRL